MISLKRRAGESNQVSEPISFFEKGYLEKDFLFFNLKDRTVKSITTHYHGFHKVVIFRQGEVTYWIEGKAYKLCPGDVLFIPYYTIHKPMIDAGVDYERVVLWIRPEIAYLQEDLLQCFSTVKEQAHYLLRLSEAQQKHLAYLLKDLKVSLKETSFGSSSLMQSYFIQLMVWLNRYLLSPQLVEGVYDARILALSDYIQTHLQENLSVEDLAQAVHLEKHYLMHLFKAQTGYSLHQYIQKKRLIQAALLLQGGEPIANLCEKCGFGDYSSFARAFKKEFQCSPRAYQKQAKKPSLRQADCY